MKKITIEKVLAAMVFLAMCCVLVVGPCAIIGFENSLEVHTTQPEVKDRMEDDKSVEVNLYEGKSSTAYMALHKESGEANPNDTNDVITAPTECVEVWETMYISKNRVKVYSEPNENANTVIELIFTNQIEVCPDTVDEGWMEIKYGEITGYIRDNCMLKRQEFLDKYHYLLAQLGTAEASIVGVAEMGRTMEVAIYRMVTTYWEFANQDTLVEVISACGQYPDSWRKIQNGLEPIPEALAVAEAILIGANETPYLTEDEFEELSDEEKVLLNDYQWQLPRNTYWQTGFNPKNHKWAVEVIARFFCRYNSDGTPYYHYYSIPAGEVPDGNVPLGD